MATRIHEFGPSDISAMGGYPVIPKSKLPDQPALTASASPTTSAPFNAATVLVCVDTDDEVYVEVGLNPSVTTNSERIAAGDEKWFEVPGGGGWSAQVRT